MDKTTAIVLTLGILALVFIAFFAVFRKSGKGKIKGPFGMGLEVEGSNESEQIRNNQIKLEKSDSYPNVKPLKITPLQPKIVRRRIGSAYAVDVEILNENQSVSGVKLRILKADPKLIAYPDVDLDALEFPLVGISDKVLHRGQRCRIHLFDTVFTGAINIYFQSPNTEGDILFTPQKKDGKPIEHILTLETSADGVDPHTQQFRLLYKMNHTESPVIIEEIQGL